MHLPARTSRLLQTARVAHLATADLLGHPHVIPICFIFDGKDFYSPIDEKPKRAEPKDLKRLRNISENPQVSLVIDQYDEDWSKLAYVLIHGKARILMRGVNHKRAVRLLRRKYPQYRAMVLDGRPMILITPKRFQSWSGVSLRTAKVS